MATMHKQELATGYYQQRAIIYRLLSALYFYPEIETKELLNNFSHWSSQLDQEFNGLAEQLKNEFDKTPLKELQIQYSQSFIGPSQTLVSPYASIHIDDQNQVMTDSSLRVLDFYRESDIKVDVREAPDHLSLELEFLSHLASHGEQSTKLKTQLDFFDQHFSLWIGKFHESVQSCCASSFYRTLTTYLQKFSTQEHDFLKQLSLSA
jgi:putative dimethyl sulfoxide reductase chaperone